MQWQDKWLEHCELQEQEVRPGRNEWEVLRAWLQKGYKLSVRARHMGMVTLRPSASNSAAPKPPPTSSKTACGKCRRMGHSSGECPYEGTLAQVNSAKEDDAEMKLTSIFQQTFSLAALLSHL